MTRKIEIEGKSRQNAENKQTSGLMGKLKLRVKSRQITEKNPILVEEKHHFDMDHNMTTLQCFDSGESAIFSRFFVKIMQVCQNLVANLNFKDHYFDTKDFD